MVQASSSRRYRGMSRHQRQSERRHRLLEAAVVEFGEGGYQNATVRGLCARAGLTERYFYESFDNREALLCAVYDDRIERLRERVLTAVTDAPGGDAPAIARAALRAYFGFMRDNPAAARVILFEILGVSAAVDRRYREAMQGFAALIRQIALPRLPAGLAARADDDMLADGLVGAVVHIAMRWVLGGYKQSLAYVTESSLTIFRAVYVELAGEADAAGPGFRGAAATDR